MIKYFSADGNTQYGEKYKHLATHEVEMPEKPEEKEGFSITARMNPDTLEGYWEEREIPKTPEEEIEILKADNQSLKTDRINTMKALVELHMEVLNLKGES